MTGYVYRRKEDEIIKEWYPKEGLPGAVVRLKQAGFTRTSHSVRRRASILKVKSPYCTANLPKGAPYIPDPKWNAAYEQACELIANGYAVYKAIEIAGIERSRFYRTRKVKDNGKV